MRKNQKINTILCETQLVMNTEYAEFLLSAINSADKSIDILMFVWLYYKNDPSHVISRINHALTTAVKRGVRVRAMVHNAEVLPYLRELGIEAKALRTNRSMHAKVFCFDRSAILLGSHNLSDSSTRLNVEMSSYIESETLCAPFCTFFDFSWSK